MAYVQLLQNTAPSLYIFNQIEFAFQPSIQQQGEGGQQQEEILLLLLSSSNDSFHSVTNTNTSGHPSSSSSSSSPFDVVILDYKMPKKDGLQVAKEILDINPEQRIIFASAYVQYTLAESVKELKRVVELMQKPFSMSALVDIVENREAYEGLKTLMSTARDVIKDLDNPSSDQIKHLFEGLRKVQKFKGF